MEKTDDQVLQILDDYKAAVFAKNVNAFIALYDRNVTVFDMWGAWSYDGIDAWREMAKGWLGSLGTDRVVVEFSDASAIVTDDMGVIHTYIKYAAVDPDDKELRSMDSRLSLMLRRNPDGWRIIHQHSSSPISPETTKAIFQRA